MIMCKWLVVLSLLLASFGTFNVSYAATKCQGMKLSTSDYDFVISDLLGPIPEHAPDIQQPVLPPNGAPKEEYQRYGEEMLEYSRKWEFLKLEDYLAQFQANGNPAIRALYDTQNYSILYRGELIPKHKKGTYPGGLERLVLILRNGKQIPVKTIITTSITTDNIYHQENAPLIFLCPLPATPVQYKEFRSETNRERTLKWLEDAWFVFLVFDRTFDPNEVVSIELQSTAAINVGLNQKGGSK